MATEEDGAEVEGEEDMEEWSVGVVEYWGEETANAEWFTSSRKAAKTPRGVWAGRFEGKKIPEMFLP